MLRACSPPTMCHMLHVMCHILCVTCHILCVMFHNFISNFFGQNGRASWWRVCYQQGLPRIVLKNFYQKGFDKFS